MDRFEEKRDVNIVETASATGVNDIFPNSDYDNVNAGGLFDKVMGKISKVSDSIKKGASIAKGATDAYDASKKKPETSSGQLIDQSISESVSNIAEPEKSTMKMPLIIGGVVVLLAIVGIIVYKKF